MLMLLPLVTMQEVITKDANQLLLAITPLDVVKAVVQLQLVLMLVNVIKGVTPLLLVLVPLTNAKAM